MESISKRDNTNTQLASIFIFTFWLFGKFLQTLFKGNVHFNRHRFKESHPSNQKLELNSSKTRLLLSRSGVLIKFKSKVFTGYSRSIQGLKLDFLPR